MDFQELLSLADSNKAEAAYEASVSRYNTDLPPPKKLPKSNVQSEGIRKFLEKKKAEEAARVAEAKKKKEQLLAIRAQNSKNNKKAKIMASRTKDNDFSKIKLTDDEVEAKKKREAELIRKNLADKVERMKARIEMEEKEKLLPKKRKRKSKNGEHIEHVESYNDNTLQEESSAYKDCNDVKKSNDKSFSVKSNGVRKAPKPPPPTLSFMELLKIAEQKQHEPLEIIQKKKEEEKPMTKKERRQKEEDLQRLRRKQERILQGVNSVLSKHNSASQVTNVNKNLPQKNTEKCKSSGVVHVEKNKPKLVQDSSKFKIPKGATNAPISKNVPVKAKESPNVIRETPQRIKNVSLSKSNMGKPSPALVEKSIKNNHTSEQKKHCRPKEESGPSLKDTRDTNRSTVLKKSGVKINPASNVPNEKVQAAPKIDEEAIERRIREKVQREMEEKFHAILESKISQFVKPTVEEKVSEAPKPVVVKKEPTIINLKPKNVPDKPKISPKDMERFMAMKKREMEQKRAMAQKPKLPPKKTFNMNPYLDPPRRLLEPQRPLRPPMKRRIESDDDDDDDDDDMSDFIDDGPSQNEEDYSKYIKEIFGYDRNRYLDDDDDDEIKETSYAEQMKEEIQSARAGYLEDLEEEKKELARKKKKKLKS